MTKSRKPGGKAPRPPSQPDPIVVANRPMLAPTAGSCHATDHLVDAQTEWQAHVDAGRIKSG